MGIWGGSEEVMGKKELFFVFIFFAFWKCNSILKHFSQVLQRV